MKGVEKIRHSKLLPRRQSRRLHTDQFAVCKFDARAFVFGCITRFERQSRNGCNCRKRLTTKTERSNREQIVSGSKLTGGMAFECQQRIVMRHSMAVSNHTDHALAARFNFHSNCSSASIQRVFEKLLHN